MSGTQKTSLGKLVGIALIALITAVFMAMSVAAFSQSFLFEDQQEEVFIQQQTSNSPQVINDLAF